MTVATENTPQVGYLAKEWCNKQLPLQVLQTRGFYIGTADEDGPCSRESVEYWPTRTLAEKALETGLWTQKSEP
jgi:hypothetical protein